MSTRPDSPFKGRDEWLLRRLLAERNTGMPRWTPTPAPERRRT
jgi:hypothetical protein